MVKFEGDNLEIGGKIYKGTPGLLELISMEKNKRQKNYKRRQRQLFGNTKKNRRDSGIE